MLENVILICRKAIVKGIELAEDEMLDDFGQRIMEMARMAIQVLLLKL